METNLQERRKKLKILISNYINFVVKKEKYKTGGFVIVGFEDLPIFRKGYIVWGTAEVFSKEITINNKLIEKLLEKNKKKLELYRFFVWKTLLHEIAHLWIETFEETGVSDVIFGKVEETPEHNKNFNKYLEKLKDKYSFEEFEKDVSNGY